MTPSEKKKTGEPTCRQWKARALLRSSSSRVHEEGRFLEAFRIYSGKKRPRVPIDSLNRLSERARLQRTPTIHRELGGGGKKEEIERFGCVLLGVFIFLQGKGGGRSERERGGEWGVRRRISNRASLRAVSYISGKKKGDLLKRSVDLYNLAGTGFRLRKKKSSPTSGGVVRGKGKTKGALAGVCLLSSRREGNDDDSALLIGKEEVPCSIHNLLLRGATVLIPSTSSFLDNKKGGQTTCAGGPHTPLSVEGEEGEEIDVPKK